METDQLIRTYRTWLRGTAAGLLRSYGHELLDDFVQEGYIAMWRALPKYRATGGVPLDFYLKQAARYRMLDIIANRPLTGQPSRRNGGHGSSIRPPDGERVLSLAEITSKDVTGEIFTFDAVEDLSAADALQRVLEAYHAGEIADALCSLTERERVYVLARFWCGFQGPETDKLFGTHSANIWKTAKPKLRARLEHLVTT